MRAQIINSCYQSQTNAAGSRFVNVNGKVYKTDNPQRYIATVKRNAPRGSYFHTLFECDANGDKLHKQYKLY